MDSEPLAEIAVASERALRQPVEPLPAHLSDVAKALLARTAEQPFLTKPLRVSLTPLHGQGAWEEYELLRLPVEATFGLTPEQGQAAVGATRTRVERQGLRMWLAVDERQETVGAIGAFLLAGHREVARLQEVDVFPAHRGRGLGDQLLESLRLVLLKGGARTLIIGADENDWPLSWYVRRGFERVARLPKPVPGEPSP